MKDSLGAAAFGYSDISGPHLSPDRSRANVLGVGVHAIDMPLAVEIISLAIESGRRGYVCVTGVHGVMESQRDPALKKIHNRAMLVTPDGMSTVWIGRLQGHSRIQRVYGPDLMLEVCKLSAARGYSHFLYGGNAGVADELAARLSALCPGIKIVGTFTPPFRPLNAQEELELIETVRSLKPDLFWVGISTPKQEKFMAEYITKLDTKVMIGVGAAFDIHTGRQKDPPAWVKNAGLQWLYRMLHEPRRLAKRYLTAIPRYLYELSLQFLGVRKYTLDT